MWIQFDAQDSHIKPFGVGVRFAEIGAIKVTFYVRWYAIVHTNIVVFLTAIN